MAKIRVAVVGLDCTDSSLEKSVSILKSVDQDQFEFEVLRETPKLAEPDMDDAYSWASIHSVLGAFKAGVDARVVIGVTSKPIEKNWFSHSEPESGTGIISIADWGTISDLPVEAYLANAVAQTTASILVSDWEGHDDTRGCLGDFCGDKTHIVEAIIDGHICDECADILRRGLGQQGLDAIQSLVDAVRQSAVGS